MTRPSFTEWLTAQQRHCPTARWLRDADAARAIFECTCPEPKSYAVPPVEVSRAALARSGMTKRDMDLIVDVMSHVVRALRREIAGLEARIGFLETRHDAERSIRATADRAMSKLSERDAQLDRIGQQLDALLEASPTARRAAAIRLQ